MNPVAVFQAVKDGSQTAWVNPIVYIRGERTTDLPNTRITGLFAESPEEAVGWNGG